MKKNFKSTIFTALVAGTALVSVSATASAGGFSVREQSAEGQGASFAGIGAGGADLSSMFFNPATITLHEGWQSEMDAALIVPFSRARNGATTPPGLGGPDSTNIGKVALVPSSYSSYQLNDNLFVGFMSGGPFGLVTKGSSTWAGSFHGIKSDLFMLQAGPVVGYKLGDMVSFGATVRLVYSDVTLTNNAGSSGIAKLKGDDWGVNFGIGLLFTPTETTRIGIGFNSATKIKYKGKLTFTGPPPAPLAPVTRLTAKLTTPETVTVGLRQKLGEQFTVLLGFEWANWSRMKQLQPIATSGVTAGFPISTTVFAWKDSYFYSIGGEYALGDNFTLRAGFAFEDSPVPTATRGVRVPDANRYWLSFGASMALSDNLRTSFGYTHIFANDGNVALPITLPFPPGPPGLTATFKQHVDIVSVSGTYTFN